MDGGLYYSTWFLPNTEVMSICNECQIGCGLRTTPAAATAGTTGPKNALVQDMSPANNISTCSVGLINSSVEISYLYY